MASLNNIHSWVISILRLGAGLKAVNRRTDRPDRPLELYEFEACPFCRKVREALSAVDLEFISHPCAVGSNNREKANGLGGKRQYPLLVDPNTNRVMYESEEIITYLLEQYGDGRSALSRLLAPLNTFGAIVASGLRPRGRVARPGARDRVQPPQMLVLYNFEASPYCRKAREALHELNLDFLVKNVAKGSPRRAELVARGGKMQVPYLIDPNTGVEIYESDDIVAYLAKTYGG